MMTKLSLFYYFIFSLTFSSALLSQKPEIAAINNYIAFNNECTHGMLVVHRLLENFNQEVNKFVDLESHQINFYSNNDLPDDIFEDTEHWFYERTPYEWYNIVINQKMAPKWQKDLNEVATQMKRTIGQINALRFEAADYIEKNDLHQRDHQEKIYEILENGVELFERFYQQHRILHGLIENYRITHKLDQNSIDLLHQQAREMLADLRYKQDNEWSEKLNKLAKLRTDVGALRGDQQRKWDAFIEASQDFHNTASVPQEYKLYGKYYYYHNSKMLNYVNRYGNGYVNATNESIDPTEKIMLMEVPHFYQVIYPSRWTDEVPLISADPIIVDLPNTLKERQIMVSDRIVVVDSFVVDLEIFDHKMIDGDIVSVNFNGDWILEDFALKGKPHKLKVQLNKEGKNYLLLHAVNLGKKPPNTMALRYRYRGQVQTVVLSSDLDASEVIELKVVQ